MLFTTRNAVISFILTDLCAASLRGWRRLGFRLFFFLQLQILEKLASEKLPLNDGDGYVCEENEPGDRVHAIVKDRSHEQR